MGKSGLDSADQVYIYVVPYYKSHSENQKMLVAFVRPQTTDGATFFSVLKSLARSYADDKRTYFIWVDPDPLPNVSLYISVTGKRLQ
jgi:hypothetical protein